MDLYIDEAGACASDTPVKTFVFPAIERRICFKDKQYRQVKHLAETSTAWFQGNSPLAASTTVVGVEGTMTGEWQIDYSAIANTGTILIASNDWQNFIQFSSASFLANASGIIQRTIILSSNNQEPVDIDVNV